MHSLNRAEIGPELLLISLKKGMIGGQMSRQKTHRQRYPETIAAAAPCITLLFK